MAKMHNQDDRALRIDSLSPERMFNSKLIQEFRSNVEYLTRLGEQLYTRPVNQTTIGALWTLLTHLKSSNGKAL